MPGRLAGKRAVITAAAQGIGRASAEMFVREGAHVIATDVNGGGLAALAGCDPRQLDVTDTQAIAALAAAAGPVDILFNCAGIVHGGTVLECTSADWSRAFEVNVTGCRYAQFYKELGAPELGFLLVCSLDFPMAEGFGPDVKLTRTQTIMQGASHCDFRYIRIKSE